MSNTNLAAKRKLSIWVNLKVHADGQTLFMNKKHYDSITVAFLLSCPFETF